METLTSITWIWTSNLAFAWFLLNDICSTPEAQFGAFMSPITTSATSLLEDLLSYGPFLASSFGSLHYGCTENLEQRQTIRSTACSTLMISIAHCWKNWGADHFLRWCDVMEQ